MTTKKCRRWTQEEKDYVFDFWGEFTIKKIARELDRTEYSIIRFAQKNNLGGATTRGIYLTTSQAADIVGVDQTTIISWVKRKLLKARTRGVTSKKISLIAPEDLAEFLENNTDKWNATKVDFHLLDTEAQWYIDKIKKDSSLIEQKRNQSWTVLEEKKLIQLIKENKTSKEISSILNRTELSVKRKRQRLLNQEAIKPAIPSAWTKRITNTIKRNWGILSLEELSKKTGKEVRLIKRYAYENGLPSLYDLEEGYFTYIDLGKLLNVSRSSIKRWVDELDLKATLNCRGNKERYVIKIEDVLPFLEENKNKMANKTYQQCKNNLEEYFKNKTIKEAI